jgi:lysozyme family protein
MTNLSPRQQDLFIRATQSFLVNRGVNLGDTGSGGDGVDGDPGPRTLAALEAWGNIAFPAVALTKRPQDMSYQELWDSMRITGPALTIDAMVRKIRTGEPRYSALSIITGVPWYAIGILHALECNCNFDRHLHNGDPLTARTKQVPAGRPLSGVPPFTWAESAADALKFDGFTGQKDWSIPMTLRRFEYYNGLGYRKRDLVSPYLWSMTNHYVRGKFVADSKYDPDAVSQQVGAAVLLKHLL